MNLSSRYRTAGTAALLLALAGCGEGREAEEAPMAADENEVAPVTAPAWPGNEETLAEGRWEQETGGERAALRFVAAGGGPVLRLACDDRGGMLVERVGAEAIGGIEMMEVNAGGEVTRLALNQPETETPVLRAAIPYNHELLAPLATAEGWLSVLAGEGERLIVPLNAETAALAATCRRPDGATP